MFLFSNTTQAAECLAKKKHKHAIAKANARIIMCLKKKRLSTLNHHWVKLGLHGTIAGVTIGNNIKQVCMRTQNKIFCRCNCYFVYTAFYFFNNSKCGFVFLHYCLNYVILYSCAKAFAQNIQKIFLKI